MFVFDIEHFLSDTRGPRYLHLKQFLWVTRYHQKNSNFSIISFIINICVREASTLKNVPKSGKSPKGRGQRRKSKSPQLKISPI